ncbi:MAG: Fis family transcriptional regulator, partial [candidate division Zixibacteria bacterium]|nr:Fis family transcriptional regulator [candidate division Zixibacteria bacterium]
DLYFRLAVVKFELPPLKNRREDIPYLVDHFIKKFKARTGKKIISVSPEVMNLLMRHDFPGNIRELENIIEYGFVICRGSIIQKEHLPEEMYKSEPDDGPEAVSQSLPISREIDEYTRILETLKNKNGSISGAAKELGIHRTTLWRKLKRYNINANSLR